MLKRTLVSTTLLVLLLGPAVARAQFNQYAFPVEKGSLESHVDVQLQYSRLDFLGEDYNIVVLSLEAQYAIKNRLEVGLNLPMVYNQVYGISELTEDAAFGDMMLNLKVRLFSLGEVLSVAAYTNVMLPTNSEADDHSYTVLFPGVAATATVFGVMLGGGVSFPWAIREGDDAALFSFDVYGGYTLLNVLTFKLALQYFNSIHPETDISPFAITPGVEVDILDIIRIGVASRIAANDDAKLMFGGRASLLFHGGISF